MADGNAWTVYRFSCTFKDPAHERGFLDFRRDKLSRNCRLVGGINIAWLSLYMVGCATTFQTSAGTFEEGAPIRLGTARFTALACVLLAVVLLLIAGVLGSRRKLGPLAMEAAIVIAASCAMLAAIAASPWYLARAFGESTEFVNEWDRHSDISVLLSMHLVIVGTHSVSVRVKAMTLFDIFVVTVYPIAALGLGAPGGSLSFGQTGIVVALTATAFFSRRSAELDQRALFQRLVLERQLRCEAEFQMELNSSDRVESAATLPNTGGASQGRKCGTLSAETESVAGRSAGSGFTADVFSQLEFNNKPDVCSMAALCELGRREHWLIEADEVHILQEDLLGSGAFGMVLPAKYLGATVVVKAPRQQENGLAGQALPTLAHELRIFRRLRHPNIAAFYGACISLDQSELVLVMEHVMGLRLDAFLVRWAPDSPTRCGIAAEVAAALRYLHCQTPAIVHGDIKGSNVVVQASKCETPKAKLIDFGLSRVISKRARPLGGSLVWLAPEILAHKTAILAPSADVFSFGRLIFMVMTNRRPKMNRTVEEIGEAFDKNKPLELSWRETSDHAMDALRKLSARCQATRPESRPGMAEAQQRLAESMLDLQMAAAKDAAGMGRLLDAQLRQLPLNEALPLARQRLAEAEAEAARGEACAARRGSSTETHDAAPEEECEAKASLSL